MEITHADFITKLEELATEHKDIKSHYKWNLKEFDGSVRNGTEFPLMTYESPTLSFSNTETNLHLTYLGAFNILGMEGVNTYDVSDEAKQNQVLNNNLTIAIELVRKLINDNAIAFLPDTTKNKWYSVLDKLSFTFTKIGPVTTHYLYGYRVEFSINPKFSTALDASKWN